MSLIDLLKLPEAKNIDDLDSPSSAVIHKKIIEKKLFLKRTYTDFYKEFKKACEEIPQGSIVEIGSGAGFIKEVIPNVITTDLFSSPNVDIVLNGEKLPFEENTISAFLLQNVLHHIKNPTNFFLEANRCLVNGGKIIMIEPHNSLWGAFFWKNFHHEPFDPNTTWEIKHQGRLSGANQALPWIIFFRDRKKFENLFPFLRIRKLTPHTPLRYLISGGLSIRQLLPSFTYDFVKGIEFILSPFNKYIGMFITIEIKKEE